MGKNVSLTTIIVILILVEVTDAAFLWNSRKLTSPSPKVSPMPSPAPGEKKSSPTDSEKAKESKTPKVDKGSPPPVKAKEGNKAPMDGTEQKDQSKSDNESCDGLERRCHDTKSMIACIRSSYDASKALILIQNAGDTKMKVDLTISSREQKNVIEIPKHQHKKVSISLAKGGTNKITLNAGYGDCLLVLQQGASISQGNYFKWLPSSYSKFMTPIYGAYFVLLTTVVAAGVWACCWFRKRKRQTEIPYQELEMSRPESAVAAPEVTEAWDQDWDDDWDEEKAVKTPGPQNISANGLTSRTTNTDGWEDWAD